MTLFEKLKDLVELGYRVKLYREGMHFVVSLKRKKVDRESWLPISDHFTEEKIIMHLDMIEKDIEKQINKG